MPCTWLSRASQFSTRWRLGDPESPSRAWITRPLPRLWPTAPPNTQASNSVSVQRGVTSTPQLSPGTLPASKITPSAVKASPSMLTNAPAAGSSPGRRRSTVWPGTPIRVARPLTVHWPRVA